MTEKEKSVTNYAGAEKVYTFRKQLNVITIRGFTSEQLVEYLYPLIAAPIVSPNRPVDVEGEIAPLFGLIANEIAFLSHMHAICLTQKMAFRSAGVTDRSPEMTDVNAKIDMLYRAIMATTKVYEATSRMLKIIDERPHSVLRKAMT